MLEQLCEVDKCVSQTDLRKRRAKQALVMDMFLECIHSVLSVTFLSLILTKWQMRRLCATCSHPYTQICKLFPHIGFSLVCFCITGWYMYMRSVIPHTYTWKMWITSQVGYLKLLISRSILSGPLDLEIERDTCHAKFPYVLWRNVRQQFLEQQSL